MVRDKPIQKAEFLNINDELILALKQKVRAAQEEFNEATVYHEAWMPTAYDSELQGRLAHSYSAHTFQTIRAALRREMFLALTRMWDKRKGALSLRCIANILGDGRVIDALAAERASHWGNLHISGLKEVYGDLPEEIITSARRSETNYGLEQGQILREQATAAIALIRLYDEDGERNSTLEYLRNLRNQRLAHRQMKQIDPGAVTAEDQEIQSFYEDMSRLVHMLMSVAHDTDYRPEQLAGNHRRYAKLFWSPVRGERTHDT